MPDRSTFRPAGVRRRAVIAQAWARFDVNRYRGKNSRPRHRAVGAALRSAQNDERSWIQEAFGHVGLLYPRSPVVLSGPRLDGCPLGAPHIRPQTVGRDA